MRLVIKIDLAIQRECDVRRVTGDVRVARRIRVSFGLAPRFDAIQEITNVECGGVATNLIDFATLQ